MRQPLVMLLILLAGLLAAVPLEVCFAGKFTDWATGSTKSESSSAGQSKPPVIEKPVMFDTAEADRLLAGMQVFPKDNAWNWDISKAPLLGNSKRMVAAMGADDPLACNLDMCFIIVPPDQKRVPVRITTYPGESDKGPFPVPDEMPIEGWPIHGGDLRTYQRQTGGDRHAIVVSPWTGMLYEFYQARRTDAGWEAAQASVFNLASNELRRDGWTSSDAAGLPIFPSIVRYDECEQGMVNHAIRVTMDRTRGEHVYPARHDASPHRNPDYPRMGERLRLRQDFDVSGFHPHVQAILKGLKKHGMMVADNGGNWRISVAPDRRIQGLGEIKRVKGSDFEVVDTSQLEPRRK